MSTVSAFDFTTYTTTYVNFKEVFNYRMCYESLGKYFEIALRPLKTILQSLGENHLKIETLVKLSFLSKNFKKITMMNIEPREEHHDGRKCSTI